jgi:hypothetical protein
MSSHDWPERNKYTPFRKPFPHSDTDVFKIRFHKLHLRLRLASGCFLQAPPPKKKSTCTTHLINTYYMPRPTHTAVFSNPNARSAGLRGRAV